MRKFVALVMAVATVFGAFWAVRSNNVPVATRLKMDERIDGSHMTVVDEVGSVLHMTGHMLETGDEWITEDNRRFQVSRVENDIAFARFVGMYDINAATIDPVPGLLERLAQRLSSVVKTAATGSGPAVAIYHTHSDESYVPSDGVSSKQGRGGVYDVGAALKNSLNNKGVNTVQDMTTHEPHDASAYQRSRRTATNLLKQRPAALFDVHRDAAPAQAYAGTVSGEDVTRVVLVVGRANPKSKANEAFARALKAEVDKSDPGLIKGIMFRNGGYNQDLYDRALLLEVGAHTNQKDSAEKAMALLSTSVAKVVGAAATSDKRTAGIRSRGVWSALGWVVGITLLGFLGYIFLSTKDPKEALAKIRKAATSDLAGLMSGNSRPKSEPQDDDSSS